MKTLNNFILERLECPKFSILEHLECPKLSILERLKLNKNTKLTKNDYVNLGLPSGTLWATSNVGATCGSTVESWYGDYFMWGDTTSATNKPCELKNYKYYNAGQIKKLIKYCPINKLNYWGGQGDPDNKLELDIEDDIANKNLGGKWHMPSKELMEELINNTTYEWGTNYKGISDLNGSLLTSKKNDNTLFFPAGGYRVHNSFNQIDNCVYIWSSNYDDTTPTMANYLYAFYTSNRNRINFAPRHYGMPIRGVL